MSVHMLSFKLQVIQHNKCTFENNLYASHHNLDIGSWVICGCCILVIISATKRGGGWLISGCLQLLEILEISWNLKTLLEILEIWNLTGPPGNFCVMIENWLMALLHDDVALFVHWRMQYKNVVNVIVGWIAQWWALVGAHHHMLH